MKGGAFESQKVHPQKGQKWAKVVERVTNFEKEWIWRCEWKKCEKVFKVDWKTVAEAGEDVPSAPAYWKYSSRAGETRGLNEIINITSVLARGGGLQIYSLAPDPLYVYIYTY